MAKLLDRIDADLGQWIAAQPVFFLASAPLECDGHVNVSPRGLDTLRVLDERRIAILDLTGSGNETAAHLFQNGRITVMFCAFSGRPKILRLYGRGAVCTPDSQDFDALRDYFPKLPGVRQIFIVDVDRIQTSCGFGVPEGTLHPRRTLIDWAERKGPDGLKAYWREKNARSIDGLQTGIALDDAVSRKAYAAAVSEVAKRRENDAGCDVLRPIAGRLTARFDHFSLAVRDLTTSRYFYGVQLGLVERARPDLGFPGVWYDLGAGQTLHLLGQSNTDEDHDVSTFPGAAAGRQSHLALRVVDWAGRLEALEAAGCMIQPSKSGRRAAFVADPDQHWVELIEAG